MKFRFSVDDNIWFLRDLSCGDYTSVFDHPYLAFYKSLHDKYHAKIQLNIYYETEGFDLSEMTDRYKEEWQKNSNWLRFSFHGRSDVGYPPYIDSSYNEFYEDFTAVNREIIRFAGEESLSLFTTVHYCELSSDALRAACDAGLKGLVGLFNSDGCGYGRKGFDRKNVFEYDSDRDIYFFCNDMIINLFSCDSAKKHIASLEDKEFVEVMIHEQYFYEDYPYYQKDFKEKTELVIAELTKQGRNPVFLEELIAR